MAADGLLLPPPPVGPGGEDSITTSEGVRCSQSINSSGGYLDLGIAGGDLSSAYSNDSYGNKDSGAPQSAVGYARIIIPPQLRTPLRTRNPEAQGGNRDAQGRARIVNAPLKTMLTAIR